MSSIFARNDVTRFRKQRPKTSPSVSVARASVACIVHYAHRHGDPGSRLQWSLRRGRSDLGEPWSNQKRLISWARPHETSSPPPPPLGFAGRVASCTFGGGTMSQTILSKPGPGIIAEHLDPQCRARIQRDAAERSAAPALGNLRVRVRRVRPSLPLSGEVCPLSGTCLPDLCSAPSRFWGQALGVQAQRASNGGVGCQGKKRQHRPHPCLAQQQGRNVLERQLGPPLCGGLDLLRGQGRGSNTQRGAPRRHQPTPLVEATLLRRLPPSCRVRAVPEDFLETPGSDAQDAQSTCTALNRTGSSSVGVASLGPLAILREDYAAWQAWYEEQQDFPARLLRVLNDGGSAVAGGGAARPALRDTPLIAAATAAQADCCEEPWGLNRAAHSVQSHSFVTDYLAVLSISLRSLPLPLTHFLIAGPLSRPRGVVGAARASGPGAAAAGPGRHHPGGPALLRQQRRKVRARTLCRESTVAPAWHGVQVGPSCCDAVFNL